SAFDGDENIALNTRLRVHGASCPAPVHGARCAVPGALWRARRAWSPVPGGGRRPASHAATSRRRPLPLWAADPFRRETAGPQLRGSQLPLYYSSDLGDKLADDGQVQHGQAPEEI